MTLKKALALLLCLLVFAMILTSCVGENTEPEESEGEDSYELPELTLLMDGTYEVSGIGSVTGTELVIPSEYRGIAITQIRDRAFYKRTGLTSVTIPDSVTSIGNSVFNGCTGLTSVTIGSGVTSIGDSAFLGCTGLESLTVSEGNTVYRSEGNCIIETNSNTLVMGCKTSVIPESVTSIGERAFEGCTGLTSITIPESVTSIESSAFDGCEALLQIENDVTYVDRWVIACSDLATSVSLREDTVGIANSAFSNCRWLPSIEIPDSVTSIGENAFANCAVLTSITIPESVRSIGKNAFCGCAGLTSITIPESVTSIGENAFSYCTELERLVVSAGNTVYRSEGNCIIETNSNTLVVGCKTSVIPASVTSIGKGAFAGCTGLNAVYYGGTVDEWSEIYVGDCNEELTSATLYYYSESEPTDEGHYWHYSESGRPVVW